MDTIKSLKDVIQSINSNKKLPAVSLLKDNLDNAALMSKLVRDNTQPTYAQDTEWASNNLNSANMKYLAHTIAQNKRANENLLELFPDMEISIQILVSSILSPKDMTNTDLIYTIEDSFLNTEITGGIINIIKDHMERHYNLTNQLPDILREVLFEAGSYSLVVIPENSLDELINRNQYITTEHLQETLLYKDQLKPLGILGNPGKKKDKDSTIATEAFTQFKRVPIQEYMYSVGNNLSNNYNISQENNEKLEPLLSLIKVTDNFNLLKLPRLIKHNQRLKLRQSIAKEASAYPTYNFSYQVNTELENLVYKNQMKDSKFFIQVKNKDRADRNPVGRPLVMNVPSEAIIPIHTPGDPSDHIAYLILIDTEGHPLNRNSLSMKSIDNLNGTTFMNANMNSPDLSDFLTNKAAYNLNGSPTNGMQAEELTALFGKVIEEDLLQRIQNGLNKSNVEIGNVDNIYSLMLARALAGQQTEILFVPADLITYFAYKFHPNGIGKSLMDDVKVLNSLRAMTMFARVMASIRNSIGVTEVKMKFDELDPDPQKTIEIMIHEIMKTRQQFFPLGINSPSDLAEWVQRSGFQFTFEGHPKIPEMSLDFEQKGYTNIKPDDELDEELKRRSILAFGLSPETVDAGFATEFATTVVSNNILLSKRVQQIQNKFTPLITEHVKKVTLNDMKIYNEILDLLDNNQKAIVKNFDENEKKLFKENKIDFYNLVINRVLEKLYITLPSPNTTTLDTQMLALNQYSDAIDKGLEAYISNEAITSNLMGDIADDVDNLKAVIKAYFMRKWMIENNVLPELNSITLADEDGKPKINLFDIQKDHIEGLLNTSADFIKSLRKTKDKINDKIGTPNDTPEAEENVPQEDYSNKTDEFDEDFDDTNKNNNDNADADSEVTPGDEDKPDKEAATGEDEGLD